jgi:serine beta-lactamase-like protein LACTB, mitochondrial
VNALYVDNTYKWAGGGFLSTTEDLARFGQRLLEGKVLRPKTVELLWTSMQTADGTPTEYGIGWTVERDSLGRRRVRHSGGSIGGTAHLVIYPDDRLVVAALVNSDYTFIGALHRYAEPFLAVRDR